MSDGSEQVTELFRALYLADLEGAGDRGLEAYRALFAGHEALIEELYARMSLPFQDGDESNERSSLGLDTSPGARVGQFRIEEEIGRGGQAVVFRALDEKLGRVVALKVLIRAAHRGDAGMQRFKREAEVCSRLNHKSICQVYDTGLEGGFPYIAMEYVDGHQLTSWARPGDGLESEFHFSTESVLGDDAPITELSEEKLGYRPDRPQIFSYIKIFIQIAEALDAAHAAGVIHRDIKPGNIMLRKDMSPVVLDFGLAQDVDSEIHALTQTGDFFGTPAYMSPEQISAHRIRLDSRSDIFSLGTSLYECVTGSRPFDASTRDGIYQAILTKEALPARKVNAEVPRDLEVVIGKAIEKDRDRRYQKASELAADLQRILDFEPIHAKPAGLPLRLLRWSQRHRGLAIGLGLLPVVVIAVIVIMVVLQTRQANEERERARVEDKRLLREEMTKLGELQAAGDLRVFLAPRLQRSVSARVMRLGEEGLDVLREELDSETASKRITALFTLVELPELAPLDDIVELCLEDESEHVRLMASQALMRIDAPGVTLAQRRVFDFSQDKGCRVNALFGLVLNEVPDAAEVSLDYVTNDENDLDMRQVLAFNLMLLKRADLDPVAAWLEENLASSQMNEWMALLAHHRALGKKSNLEALKRIQANQKLSPMIQKRLDEAIEELHEKRDKPQAN